MQSVKDTSQDYDDLVGYKAKETILPDLSSFLGEQIEHKPTIKPKPVDPDFPEEWQNLFVNFRCEEDFINFMKLIGETPGPKINTVVFSKNKTNGILDFF
jgi:hypothetical protein